MNIDPAESLRSLAEQFLATVRADQRGTYYPHLNKFLNWIGPDRTPGSLTGHEIERFATEVVERAPASAEAIRSFLAYLKKQGYTQTNLGTNIRVRRSGPLRTAPTKPTETLKITAEGLAALKRELESLIALKPELAHALQTARADGDVRENAPLDAARERQGQIEARIRQLEAQIRMAEVVDAPSADHETAQLGSTVVLFDEKFNEEVRFMLVGASEADPRRGRISIASPTGRALLGRRADEQVEVEAPGGLQRYRILRIEA